MAITLHGYRYSVYTTIARLTLAEKGVSYAFAEINPFNSDIDKSYLEIHPFRRVPALVHNQYVIYETTAITRYIDEGFDGASLQPQKASERGRMMQIISIIDAYGYWPMIRQVFDNRVFKPLQNEVPDEISIKDGIQKSTRVLEVLENLIGTNQYLCSSSLSLADLHLAPIMGLLQNAVIYDREPAGIRSQ